MIACSNTPDWAKLGNGNVMTAREDTLTRVQLDSLCVADSLSTNFAEDWLNALVIDDDRQPLVKYGFIKELTDSTELIYTLSTYQDSLFIMNKRITTP